ncbi:MAG: ABC transporter ATP-binding protein, partial [Gammaproteobacteria bacterium]
LTTHYLEEAERMCRNVAIIDEGLLIENTSMSSLLKTLNSEAFILYLRDNIAEAPVLDGFSTRMLDPYTIEVEVPETRSLNDLMQQLDAQGIVVNRMRNKVNRLEELFVKITTKPNGAHKGVGAGRDW